MTLALGKAVVVARNLPDPRRSSGERRFSELIAYLRARAASLVLFYEYEDHLGLYGDLDVRPVATLGEGARGAELALCEFWHMAAHFPVLRAARVPIVLDSVDVEFVRRAREGRLLGEGEGYFAVERAAECRAYREADLVLAVGPADARVLRGHAARVVEVPNLYPRDAARAPFERRRGVCFVGSYKHQPNVDALRWYRDAVLPRLVDLPHTFIGHDAPEDVERLPGFLGGVPDAAAYVRGARVSVAPLRYGAGLKGKVLEAAAVGTPVVTTSTGDEGYGGGARGAFEVEDEPAAFAAAVRGLYDDAARWEAASRAAWSFAADYEPARVGEALDRALTAFLAAVRGRG